MRYGKLVNGNLQLYSYVHTSKDIQILTKKLKDLYGINCYKHECTKDYYIINIDKESVDSIIKIVTSFCETYKLHNIGLFRYINKKNIFLNNPEKKFGVLNRDLTLSRKFSTLNSQKKFLNPF